MENVFKAILSAYPTALNVMDHSTGHSHQFLAVAHLHLWVSENYALLRKTTDGARGKKEKSQIHVHRKSGSSVLCALKQSGTNHITIFTNLGICKYSKEIGTDQSSEKVSVHRRAV